MTKIKKTNNELLGLNELLTSIDLKEVNQKTAYWMGRNIRKIASTVKSFQELHENIKKDAWFSDFQTATTNNGEEKAREEFKDQLAEADKEIEEFLKTETEIDFYLLSIDVIDVKSEHIPRLMDLISE